MKPPAADGVYLQHVADPKVFMHWDPRHETYIYGVGVLGACAFTMDNARGLLSSLATADRRAWKIVRIPGPVSHEREPADVYEKLYKTRPYMRVSVTMSDWYLSAHVDTSRAERPRGQGETGARVDCLLGLG